MPDAIPAKGNRVEVIPQIAAAPEFLHGLLLVNPMRLYWPEVRLGDYGDIFALD